MQYDIKQTKRVIIIYLHFYSIQLFRDMPTMQCQCIECQYKIVYSLIKLIGRVITFE